MSRFTFMRRKARPRAENEGEATPPPFPTISTFLGLAVVMIVIWLLVYGPPFSASDHSAPSNTIDTGASK
ncbi:MULTISPECIES: hypothetical protein [unclassified Mesorhizobium]|uniref:hypothetical protein n=1 Tax=unclassified Mesorhizobium TaxID=325217 RepID=UPI000FCA317D|nr:MULTISPECIES: hypothetical protein [unclassified Mesorhizobium]RUW73228.1 hypothetical protein EOA31_13690 [Mesorhizobium sp. M4B.F.Ca.ET.049.02.1.2]TGV28712.1 hypothetical protein EN786_03030 [Mesorhizobium sp. M4B.F.Ca.ET.143.01.1.1]